jgi:predicted DNA-binding transcriptional regulator AlpA
MDLLESKRYTPAEAAEKLGVAVSTLANWRSSGHGPVSVRIGRNVWYFASDIEAWLQQEHKKATAARTVPTLLIQGKKRLLRRFDRRTGHGKLP